MGRKAHRRQPDGGDGVSWEALQAEAVGVVVSSSLPDLREEHGRLRRRLDAKFGAGAGDEVPSRIVNTAQVYARLLGMNPDDAARVSDPSWELGTGYEYKPPPEDDRE